MLRAGMDGWLQACSVQAEHVLRWRPTSIRLLQSFILGRWAALARLRRVPRLECGRLHMLQRAISSRAVWTCFAVWHMCVSSDQAAVIGKAVKSMGAFDIGILRAHPQLRPSGLTAMRARMLELGRPLQLLMSGFSCAASGFMCHLHRHVLLLSRVSFKAWCHLTARIMKRKAMRAAMAAEANDVWLWSSGHEPLPKDHILHVFIQLWFFNCKAQLLRDAVLRGRVSVRRHHQSLTLLHRCRCAVVGATRLNSSLMAQGFSTGRCLEWLQESKGQSLNDHESEG
eukprot:TRINITY_DN78550_c0_g1_i1.p1 TRINITY_DN78550_c0_g1~~TRINITY_DN78550_c0_g1_i1.p1  ORF type:complete len:298 (+),score=27.57 TRINITY_DN78550_c0_g1_i1:43-894(+)